MISPKSIEDAGLAEEAKQLRIYATQFYQKCLEYGVPREDARYYTFEGGTVSLAFTMNTRELKHFLSLRCCRRAQWEIRKMADEVAKIIKPVAPVMFETLGAPCQMGEKCPEGSQSCGNPREAIE